MHDIRHIISHKNSLDFKFDTDILEFLNLKKLLNCLLRVEKWRKNYWLTALFRLVLGGSATLIILFILSFYPTILIDKFKNKELAAEDNLLVSWAVFLGWLIFNL
jgi:hypothetical protein